MRFYYGLFLAVLLLSGLILIYVKPAPPSGEAGVAYQYDAQGNLVPSDGTRQDARTIVKKRDDGSDAEWLKKWVLIERSGKELGSEDLAGKPYVAGFFYSTCPSICVQQNSKVKELQDEFEGQPVRFVAISCDPEVDRPDVLAKYAERYDADPQQWLFFTGEMDYIRRVGQEYFSLGVMRRGHPEKFALMDKNGELYGLYTWSDEGQWKALRGDIAKLIAAGGAIDEVPDDADAQSPDLQQEG